MQIDERTEPLHIRLGCIVYLCTESFQKDIAMSKQVVKAARDNALSGSSSISKPQLISRGTIVANKGSHDDHESCYGAT